MTRYEDSLAQLHKEKEKNNQQYRELHSQLVDKEQQVADQKVQLTTLQGNYKEMVDQLAERSRQVAALKTDLDRTNHQNQSMADEVKGNTSAQCFTFSCLLNTCFSQQRNTVRLKCAKFWTACGWGKLECKMDFCAPQISIHEDQAQKMAKELNKMQELNLQSEEELQKYEIRFQELQSDLLKYQDRNRQSLAELAAKDEELVVHKVELSTFQEKFRGQADEVRSGFLFVCLLFSVS